MVGMRNEANTVEQLDADDDMMKSIGRRREAGARRLALMVRRCLLAWMIAACALSVGCSRSNNEQAETRSMPGDGDYMPQADVGDDANMSTGEGLTDPARLASAPLVVFLGDSLTAGLHLSNDQAFPAIVERQLRQSDAPIRVVNAGVSGDTTAGGARRVDWVLRQQPDVLFVCLGANDGMRGQPIEQIEANLISIIDAAQAAGARVLLAGMRLPPNYGDDYANAFAEIYPRVAEAKGVTLLPFLLKDVAGLAELNMPDGIHPNAEGQAIIAEHVMEVLRPMIAVSDGVEGAAADEATGPASGE